MEDGEYETDVIAAVDEVATEAIKMSPDERTNKSKELASSPETHFKSAGFADKSSIVSTASVD